ncbi:sulfotransferase [Phaeocystidibacter marisrubri]|uniref:Sulfotransferase n=1 Tax=Phaeocystidibacter marisrubri TaxID=1577780 RepID=A0A6L3ZDK9_9FLAO|nr:sulfotransferase [Phaeocystidibacter marisrubri]KAB2815658.1 hypothetical protein F8C82_08115 [Phaeocystidibacter marisrubri]GGH65029.1 hypothetical protein GCM10011318_01640 [Phaeocystidibacter marisrubri]
MFRLQFYRPIIIIGMHRSGTSLVAKLLHDCGINMGEHRDHNEESFPFLNVNQEVMKEHGSSWIDPSPLPAAVEAPQSAMGMYVNHFQLDPSDFVFAGRPRNRMVMWLHNQKWGFKDPRNSFTLSMWLKLYPKAKVIHVIRHPSSVADSLKRRNEIDGEVFDERLNDLNFNLQLWKKYVVEAERQMALVPKSRKKTIKYEDILQGGTALTDLGRFVGEDLVKTFSDRIHPDRGRRAAEIDLSSVSDVLTRFGYDQ